MFFCSNLFYFPYNNVIILRDLTGIIKFANNDYNVHIIYHKKGSPDIVGCLLDKKERHTFKANESEHLIWIK